MDENLGEELVNGLHVRTKKGTTMDLHLSRLRAVITGGTSGIGFATAEALAAEGASVGIISRSAGHVAEAVERLQGLHPAATIVGVAGDVADEDSIGAAVRTLGDQLGGIDVIVNSAGIAGELGGAPDSIPGAEFLEVQRVNVVGSYLAVKAALPYLKEGDTPSILLIGSDSGFVTAPGMLAYNASKGAIVQLTRALAVELHGPFGIRVNSVCPSIVDTPLARDGMGVESFADVDYPVNAPEDIAWLVLSLISPRSRSVNGASLLADFGYHAQSSFPA